MRTLIIIPAFNEEANVPLVIREAQRVVPGADVLVVNDAHQEIDAVRTAALPGPVAQLVSSVFVRSRAVDEAAAAQCDVVHLDDGLGDAAGSANLAANEAVVGPM